MDVRKPKVLVALRDQTHPLIVQFLEQTIEDETETDLLPWKIDKNDTRYVSDLLSVFNML